MEGIVYVNGNFMPADQAGISPFDRGYSGAESVYEIIRWHRGSFYQFNLHLSRLQLNMLAISIRPSKSKSMEQAARQLIRKNRLQRDYALLYIQVSAGPSQQWPPRFEQPHSPTLFMAVAPFQPDTDQQRHGIRTILLPDSRGVLTFIKSNNHLAHTLALSAALAEGADEALFTANDIIYQGSHSNFFAVYRGQVITAPAGPRVMAGITRETVIAICRDMNIPVYENPIYANQLRHFDELFITSTRHGITPVIEVQSLPIRDATPGSITRQLQAAFRRGLGLK